MRVVGAAVRVKSKRYVAGFAVVDGDDLSRPLSLPAPAGVDEGRQLEELYRTTYDLLGEFGPDELALKVYEALSKKALAVGQRGEGAVLAAAGARGVGVRLWFGAGLLRPSGLKAENSHEERVAALCAQVTGEVPRDKEIADAVAAARASVVTSDG